MKRFAEDRQRMLREQKRHASILGYCRFAALGRFRKKDGFDCGNARCHRCHSNKLPKRIPTRQEITNG